MSNKTYIPKRKKSFPSEVGAVLQTALRAKGIDKDLDRYRFILEWDQIVGDEIAKRTCPECMRGSTLIVKVSDSTWAQELSFQKEVIIKRMNRICKDTAPVSDIRFVVG